MGAPGLLMTLDMVLLLFSFLSIRECFATRRRAGGGLIGSRVATRGLKGFQGTASCSLAASGGPPVGGVRPRCSRCSALLNLITRGKVKVAPPRPRRKPPKIVGDYLKCER